MMITLQHHLLLKQLLSIKPLQLFLISPIFQKLMVTQALLLMSQMCQEMLREHLLIAPVTQVR